MPKRPLTPMPMAQRAKQFMPFRALVGFEETLGAMETEPTPRPELTEEMIQQINETLRDLQSKLLGGNNPVPVSLSWYQAGEIHRITDRVRRLDTARGILFPEDHPPISLENLLQLNQIDGD